MTVESVVNVIAWLLIIMAVVNVFFVVQATRLHRAVHPRSPVLGALWWVAVSIWLLSVYFAVVAVRYLADISPALPFGGIGLGVVVIFVLTVPAVIYVQMRQFLDTDETRHDARDAGRDEGRDPIRDEARDEARDIERDANGS
jgi:hypothetical protein